MTQWVHRVFDVIPCLLATDTGVVKHQGVSLSPGVQNVLTLRVNNTRLIANLTEFCRILREQKGMERSAELGFNLRCLDGIHITYTGGVISVLMNDGIRQLGQHGLKCFTP